jgi:hypothetical protein
MLKYLHYIKVNSFYTEESANEFKHNIYLLESEHNVVDTLLNCKDYEQYELIHSSNFNLLKEVYSNYIKLFNLTQKPFEINNALKLLINTKDKHLISLFNKISGLTSEFDIITSFNLPGCESQNNGIDFLTKFNTVYDKYIELGGDTTEECKCNLL